MLRLFPRRDAAALQTPGPGALGASAVTSTAVMVAASSSPRRSVVADFAQIAARRTRDAVAQLLGIREGSLHNTVSGAKPCALRGAASHTVTLCPPHSRAARAHTHTNTQRIFTAESRARLRT